jgi:hypothetical protein
VALGCAAGSAVTGTAGAMPVGGGAAAALPGSAGAVGAAVVIAAAVEVAVGFAGDVVRALRKTAMMPTASSNPRPNAPAAIGSHERGRAMETDPDSRNEGLEIGGSGIEGLDTGGSGIDGLDTGGSGIDGLDTGGIRIDGLDTGGGGAGVTPSAATHWTSCEPSVAIRRLPVRCSEGVLTGGCATSETPEMPE